MKSIVIKVGGELIAPASRLEATSIAADLAALRSAGHRLVVVHGGGPQTSALQKRLGQEPKMVGGRRITDEAALEAIEMVVGGKLNIELCALLRKAGVNALGLHGISGGLIQAEKRPPRAVAGSDGAPVDFGLVGDVSGVDRRLLELLIAADYVPVVACVGGDRLGNVFNINADLVAASVAVSLDADHLVLVTSTPGVLRDLEDPKSRISTLTLAEGQRAIAERIVAGGMIAKLEEAFVALQRGVRRVHVIGRVQAGDLQKEMADPGSVGTTLLP